MKILVLGAGGVGGYFGGRMHECGADVTFLVRPARAATIVRDGLRIASKFGDARLQVKCLTQDRVAPGYDIVLFTAKAYDLAATADAVAPAMDGNTRLLPLLNGMAHLRLLDGRFGRERVLGGVAYIGATLAPDGGIRHLNDFHRIAFGPRHPSQADVCARFAAALAGVGFNLQPRDDIEQAMWDKWVNLATLAGMTCLMRAVVGDIVATAAGERLTLSLLDECAAIARAEGFATPEPVLANYRGLLTKKDSLFSASMMRDLEAGGSTEGAHILGELLAIARSRAIAAPLLEIAATHLEAYDARRRREARA